MLFFPIEWVPVPVPMGREKTLILYLNISDSDTEKLRRKCSERLRDDLSVKSVARIVRRIYILLPTDESHESTHLIEQVSIGLHKIIDHHENVIQILKLQLILFLATSAGSSSELF